MANLNEKDATALSASLLEDKQQELKAAKAPDFGGALLRTGTGAFAGLATGTVAVLAGALSHGIETFKRVIEKNPDLLDRLEKMNQQAVRNGEKLTPQMEKEITEFGERFAKALEHESTVGSRMVKGSNGWILGLTAAGAGLGALWQARVHSQKVEHIEKEVTKLQQLNDSWQERLVGTNDSPASPALMGK